MKCKTVTVWALAMACLLTAFCGTRSVRAEDAKDGDYVIVTLNGSDTYETEANGGKTLKVHRHGRIKGGFVYYIDPDAGWKGVSKKAVKVEKYAMPAVGDAIYVIANDRVFKTTLKKIGAGAHDTGELFIKVDIVDGKMTINDLSCTHYASEDEFAKLGWTVPDAKMSSGRVHPDIAEEELHKIEQQAYDKLNEVRANPGAYAEEIEKLYGTKDERAVELVKFLHNMEGKKAQFVHLERNAGLDAAARDHAQDHCKNPDSGHRGTSDCADAPNDNWVGCRMSRHGTSNGMYAENIFARGGGEVYNGGSAMSALMLDHGVDSRGHRAGYYDVAVFNETFDDATSFHGKFTQVGIGVAYDKGTGYISIVWVFANEFHPK